VPPRSAIEFRRADGTVAAAHDRASLEVTSSGLGWSCLIRPRAALGGVARAVAR
jgi:hypothetical protein